MPGLRRNSLVIVRDRIGSTIASIGGSVSNVLSQAKLVLPVYHSPAAHGHETTGHQGPASTWERFYSDDLHKNVTFNLLGLTDKNDPLVSIAACIHHSPYGTRTRTRTAYSGPSALSFADVVSIRDSLESLPQRRVKRSRLPRGIPPLQRSRLAASRNTSDSSPNHSSYMTRSQPRLDDHVPEVDYFGHMCSPPAVARVDPIPLKFYEERTMEYTTCSPLELHYIITEEEQKARIAMRRAASIAADRSIPSRSNSSSSD